MGGTSISKSRAEILGRYLRENFLKTVRAFPIAILLTSLSCATPPHVSDQTSTTAAPKPAPIESAISIASIPPNATQFVYQVPPVAPEGEVKIVAMGWTEIRTQNDDSVKLPALHIRFIANKRANSAATDAQDWSLDVRLQQIQFAGFDDVIRPLFVSAASENLPYVRVGNNQEAAIELYYPLPAPLALAAQKVPLPKFDLRWSILTSLQSLSETTQPVELYPEAKIKSIYPNLTQQKRAKVRAPAATLKHAAAQNQVYWWQDPFGEVPPAFSTISIW